MRMWIGVGIDVRKQLLVVSGRGENPIPQDSLQNGMKLMGYHSSIPTQTFAMATGACDERFAPVEPGLMREWMLRSGVHSTHVDRLVAQLGRSMDVAYGRPTA